MTRLAQKHARFAMRSLRFGSLTLALLLAICLLPERSFSALSQTPDNGPAASTPQYMAFSATASMKTARYGHTATLLKNGKVLVVGGGASTVAEVYDPTTGTWSDTGDIGRTLYNHSAILLPNGKVLVVQDLVSILYDPETNSWSNTGNMVIAAEIGHTTTLLQNGKVLLVNGVGRNNAALYDSISDAWSTTGNSNVARGYHSATLLNDGRVLVAGGRSAATSSLASAELYDPTTETWTMTDSMISKRELHTATLLQNGEVLVVGGSEFLGDSYPSVELYSPVTGAWTKAADTNNRRLNHTTTLLSSGELVVIGGDVNSRAFSSIEVYDHTTGTWRLVGQTEYRHRHTATLLDNTKILVAGGNVGWPNTTTSKIAQLATLSDDTDLPTGTITINGGALVSTALEVTLGILGQDATSGVGQISLSNDGQTWEPWQRYSESLEWKLSPGDGPKTVYVRFKDYAGNVSAPVSRSIRLDSAAGNEYGLTINNGALFTNQITVELRLSAPALTPEMMISNDGGFAGATWEPYNSVRSWQITQYGSYVLPRTVYVRFRDASGKIFGPYQDDILLDVNAPSGSVTVLSALRTSEQSATTPSADTAADYSVLLPFVTKTGECPAAGTVNVTLALSAEDDVSGVADMIISNSENFACAKWEPFSKTKAWKVAANAETPIYVRFRDHAGNVSTVYSTVARP
jgi:Kelch motif.